METPFSVSMKNSPTSALEGNAISLYPTQNKFFLCSAGETLSLSKAVHFTNILDKIISEKGKMCGNMENCLPMLVYPSLSNFGRKINISDET